MSIPNLLVTSSRQVVFILNGQNKMTMIEETFITSKSYKFLWMRETSTDMTKGVICLFKHEKLLFHPVAVERPNPQYAALLQEQLGGGNGELKAAI